jgi:hypothetical protein
MIMPMYVYITRDAKSVVATKDDADAPKKEWVLPKKMVAQRPPRVKNNSTLSEKEVKHAEESIEKKSTESTSN